MKIYVALFLISKILPLLESLRMLTGKKHAQKKLKCLRKVWIWSFGSILYKRFLNWQKISKKIGKTLFFVISSILYHPIYLTLTEQFVFISNLVLLTKKLYFSFLKMVFVCQKKKMFLSSTFPVMHVDLSNGGLIWKSPVPFFRRAYALFDGFNMKRLTSD